MSSVVFYCWCHSHSASVLLYFTFLSHLFPLPCGAGRTVPREGFDSSVIMLFFLVRCGCDTSDIVSIHIQCPASIYTLSLCHGHSWRVRLAKQEKVTPPGHLVSPLVCRGSVNVHRVSIHWSRKLRIIKYMYNAWINLMTCNNISS